MSYRSKADLNSSFVTFTEKELSPLWKQIFTHLDTAAKTIIERQFPRMRHAVQQKNLYPIPAWKADMVNSLFFHFVIVLAMLATVVPRGANSHDEESAYLRQAATEAVEWRAFGSAAFAEARQRDRPLLIDVGAVWCRYCRVMDRESYSKARLAKFINENFIPIKVDYDGEPETVRRLERAQALANLPAGLPLIMIVTPNRKVFAGGTYFPAKRSAEKPGFLEMLQSARHEFNADSSRIEREGIDLRLEVNQ